MPPGRPRTTHRSRNAGGKELRTWVSAAEYQRAEQRAAAAGMELGEYIRRAVLGERLEASPSPWKRREVTLLNRILEHVSEPCRAVVHASAVDKMLNVACGDPLVVTSGLSDWELAGVLMMEGVQPPAPEDLEWVRGAGC